MYHSINSIITNTPPYLYPPTLQVPQDPPEDGLLQIPCNFDAVIYDNLSRVADADVLSTTVADATRSLRALDAREAVLKDSLSQLEGFVQETDQQIEQLQDITRDIDDLQDEIVRPIDGRAPRRPMSPSTADTGIPGVSITVPPAVGGGGERVRVPVRGVDADSIMMGDWRDGSDGGEDAGVCWW